MRLVLLSEMTRLTEGFHLKGAGVTPWKWNEHHWLEDMDMETHNKKEKVMYETPRFDSDEERRKHLNIDKLMGKLLDL